MTSLPDGLQCVDIRGMAGAYPALFFLVLRGHARHGDSL